MFLFSLQTLIISSLSESDLKDEVLKLRKPNRSKASIISLTDLHSTKGPKRKNRKTWDQKRTGVVHLELNRYHDIKGPRRKNLRLRIN